MCGTTTGTANSSAWMNMTNRVTEMNAQNRSQVAFILSTLGGLLIVVSGIFSLMWFMTGGLPHDEWLS
jgi:uncharacterized membrane protein